MHPEKSVSEMIYMKQKLHVRRKFEDKLEFEGFLSDLRSFS